MPRGLKSPWSKLSDSTEERDTILASREIHSSIMAQSFKRNQADKKTGPRGSFGRSLTVRKVIESFVKTTRRDDDKRKDKGGDT